MLGIAAFALNGALTAKSLVRLDFAGAMLLGIITATGGGVIRDILLGAHPPTVFTGWSYITLAAGTALIGAFIGREHPHLEVLLRYLDAIGIAVFSVVGAQIAVDAGLETTPAIALGVITALGGGVLRDLLIMQVPFILSRELYATPAIVGAAVFIIPMEFIEPNPQIRFVAALAGIAAAFGLRVLGMKLNLRLPAAPAPTNNDVKEPFD